MTDQAPEQRSLFYKDDLLRFASKPVSQRFHLWKPQGNGLPLTHYSKTKKEEAQVEDNTHASVSFYGKNVIL